jgi:hypothetical protein
MMSSSLRSGSYACFAAAFLAAAFFAGAFLAAFLARACPRTSRVRAAR